MGSKKCKTPYLAEIQGLAGIAGLFVFLAAGIALGTAGAVVDIIARVAAGVTGSSLRGCGPAPFTVSNHAPDPNGQDTSTPSRASGCTNY